MNKVIVSKWDIHNMSLVSENLLKWTIYMKYDNIIESNQILRNIFMDPENTLNLT